MTFGGFNSLNMGDSNRPAAGEFWGGRFALVVGRMPTGCHLTTSGAISLIASYTRIGCRLLRWWMIPMVRRRTSASSSSSAGFCSAVGLVLWEGPS